MSDEEVRKAAEIVEKHKTRQAYQPADILLPAMRTLADWAISELARREDQQAERDLPLTNEWCQQQGALPDLCGGVAWKIWDCHKYQEDMPEEPAFHLLTVDGSLWIECYDTGGNTLGIVELFENPTRGQVLDLLRDLKGGEA